MNEYIGIPYRSHGRDRAGCDCWGLVDLFYREQLGITLPSYLGAYRSADDTREVEVLLVIGKAAWSPVALPRLGDLLLLRVGGRACHVGILLGDGTFLHVLKGRNSTIEPVDGVMWITSAEGVYRWTAAI